MYVKFLPQKPGNRFPLVQVHCVKDQKSRVGLPNAKPQPQGYPAAQQESVSMESFPGAACFQNKETGSLVLSVPIMFLELLLLRARWLQGCQAWEGHSHFQDKLQAWLDQLSF